MVNWQEPQKQSALGIFVFAGKAFREMVAVLLIAVGSLARKDKPFATWALWIGGIALFIFGKAFLEYYFFSFQVSGRELVIHKGIFSKKKVIIPFERIQTVQLQQSLFHKIIRHCKLTIDTAGTEKTEVAIQALSYARAIELKEVLTQQVAGVAEEQTTQESNLVRLSVADLFKIAITANHLETLWLILAFVLARFEDVKDLLGFNAYDWVETQGGSIAFTSRVIAFVIFFAVAVSMLISVLRIVLRYADLTITLGEKGFQLKHGLLHSQQQFIGTRKIQYILWRANWLRRKLGLQIFHVKTVGEDELVKKQKIHLPVTTAENLSRLAGYYQADLPSATTTAAGIRKEYIFRKILFTGIPITAIAITIAWFWWGWNAAWLGLWFLYHIIDTIVYHRNFKIWANETAIEISKGTWGRERIVLNWQKLQVVTIQQGIYQRRKNFANLLLRTASGDVVIPYLEEAEAKMLADYAAMKIEASQEKWM